MIRRAGATLFAFTLTILSPCMWGRLPPGGGLPTRHVAHIGPFPGPAQGRLTIGRRLSTCPTWLDKKKAGRVWCSTGPGLIVIQARPRTGEFPRTAATAYRRRPPAR